MNDDIAGEGRGGRIMPDECWGSQIMSSDLVLLTVAPGWWGGQTSDISQQDNNYFSIWHRHSDSQIVRHTQVLPNIEFTPNKQPTNPARAPTMTMRQKLDQIWPLSTDWMLVNSLIVTDMENEICRRAPESSSLAFLFSPSPSPAPCQYSNIWREVWSEWDWKTNISFN